ncbi:MAG: MarR family winged helix-turn-helix transcriptional regulator, partial [Acidimicrobiales bacterium]
MADVDRHIAALDQVFELTVLLHDDMTASLARDGLTTSRAHLLWELRQLGPTTQTTLADALGVSARNVTGLVDGLVAGGFVTRE